MLIVIGGGNFGEAVQITKWIEAKSDQIGMLATVMNALYIAEVCRSNGLDAVVQTPFQIE